MKSMKYLLTVLFFTVAVICYAEDIDDRPLKRVLMLVSYHMTHDWTSQLAHGIQRGTENLPYRLDYNIVELDALRSRDKKTWEKKFQSYLPSLQKRYYDMVVVLDDDAVDLVLENYALLPPDLPVVFAGYENYSPELLKKYPNMTGVVQNFNVEDSISTGLKLFPGTRNVVILVDSTPTGRRFEASLKEKLPSFKGVNVTYLNDAGRTIPEIFAEIRKLQNDSLVVLTPWRGLYNREYQSLVSFGIDLTRAAGRPFLVCDDSLFGHGALGGNLVSAADHAKDAASVIKKVIRRGSAKNVPVLQSVPRPTFDYEVMFDHQLRFNVLPADTLLLNCPPALWQTHRKELLILIAGIVILFLGIISYVYLSRRALYRSLALFRALPGRIGVCTRKERILFLHAEDPDVTGKNIRYIRDIPHIDYEKISKAIVTVFATKQPLTMDYEYRHLKRALAIAPLDPKVFGEETIVWFSHDNAELQESRRTAEENAERFSQTLLCIGDAVIATDREGRITIVNPVAEKLTGCKQKEVLGHSHEEVFRIVDYVDNSPIVSPLTHALATGMTVAIAEHTDLLSLDGSRYHIADSAAPIKNSRGEVIGAILVFRDVTEEYDKRDRLRNNTLSLEYASGLARFAAFRFDPVTNRIEGSELLPELCPIENGYFLQEEKWVYPEDLYKLLDAKKRLIDRKDEVVCIDYRSSYFGGMRYFRLKAALDKNDTKGIALVGVVQDVTEITTSLQKLQESLPLWDLVMNSIPFMFFVKNGKDDFRYVMVNRAFEKFLGSSAENIVGKTDADVFRLPKDAESFRTKDLEIMKNAVSDDFVEFVTDFNGESHWLRTIKKPFSGIHDEPMLMGVSIDITELQNLIESERIINKALTQIALESNFRYNVKQLFATLADQMNCDYIMLSSYDHTTEKYTLYHEWNPGEVFSRQTSISDDFFDSVGPEFKSGKLIKIPRVEESFLAARLKENGTRSFVAVPVFVENKFWGGLLVAFCKQERFFSKVDENIMRSTANIIALAQIRERQLRAINLADREKQLILNNIKIPIWLYDRTGGVLRVNTAACRISGRPEKELTAKSYRDVFSEELDPLEKRSVLQVIETGHSARHEASFNGRDYIVNAEPVFNDKNELIYIVRSAVDVTDLNSSIKNEKVVNTCLEALFKAENMDDAVHQFLQEIGLHTGADRCYILQYHPEDTTISLEAEYAAPGNLPLVTNDPRMPLTTQDQWYQKLLRHEFVVYSDLSSPESRQELGIWYSLVEKFQLCSCFISAIYLDGKLWGNFGLTYGRKKHEFSELNLNFLHAAAHLIELILQRKSAQEQLFAALREAQSADKAKSYFIASVSHEIRTPLNAVIGFSELLRDEELDRKTQKDYLDSIAYSGNALLQLINDVLDLSKLEAGQMTIVLGGADIRELCQDVMKVFQHRILEKNLELGLKIENVPLLSVDKLRIRQILFNLIGNAVKFTEKGSITVSAEFTFSSENAGVLRLGVRDTGIGISSADCKNLAAPFVQLSGMRGTHAANNGTGLGLAISKRMAEAMNGELFIESELGRGSFFYIMLYNVKVETALLPETSKMEKVLMLPSVLSVLVVDDVEMNLKVLQAMLSKAGVKDVARATSAKEALGLLHTRRFDIVLTDIWMPEMSGAELAAEIKKDPALARIPVIALTADMEANASFSMENFSGVLLKPVTVDKLKIMLNSAANGTKNIRI